METYTEEEFMKLTDNEKWIAYGELLGKYTRMKWHPPFTPLNLCKSVEHILGRKLDDKERLFATNTWGWCNKNGFVWPTPRNDEKHEMDKYNVALWVSRKIVDGIK